MFDLFRSRQKAVRILLGVLLGMVALSMLVYLIPGAGAPMGNKNDQIVAEIGKEPVTVHDVEVQIHNILQNRSMSPDVVSAVISELVDQSITDRAMAYEAQQLGFELSERDLANAIRSLGPVSGMTPQQYRQFVEQQMQQSLGEFENGVRLSLFESAIQNIATEGAIVTPAEVEAEFRKHGDRVKVDYVLFDPQKLGAELKPSVQDLQKYFLFKRGLFNQPETRDVQLLVADQAKVSETIQIPDSEIQSYYNSHKDQFRTPERVKARHILVMTKDKPKDQVQKLKAKADDLLKQVKGGGDFAKLAEKNSDDTSSAVKGGDLGWVTRGQMVKPFEDATFALSPKEISGVITTEYGFHIIQVLEKEQARLRTLDEARPEILGGLRNQLVFDKMQAVADQAHAELVKAPQNGQAIANKLGLLFASVNKFKTGVLLPNLETDSQAIQLIKTLQKGEVSQVFQSGNKLAMAVVTAVNPIRSPEFAEVEAQVRARYAQDNGDTAASDKAKKVADLARANGGDLNAAAKSVGLEVKSTDLFTRTGTPEGIGSALYMGEAFQRPVGAIVGPVRTNGPIVVVKLIEKAGADMSKLDAERAGIVTSLKSKKSGERQVLLQDSVLNYLIRQGKVKKHQDVINRLIARYRG